MEFIRQNPKHMSYGINVGVQKIGTYSNDEDLPGWCKKYEIKEINFDPDKIETKAQLKWNDKSVMRKYQYGPTTMVPRFGQGGQFFVTDRGGRNKLIEGIINETGDIVELSKMELEPLKEGGKFALSKEYKIVDRILKKVAKFIVK